MELTGESAVHSMLRQALRGFAVVVSVVLVSMSTVTRAADDGTPGSHLFGWPFLDPAEVSWRGGTTRGAPVTLEKEADPRWRAVMEPGLEDFERDRRAILALAGDYRVSFEFIESAGFSPGYTPAAPYFSWSTEHVRVLRDEGDFISLQHVLVMYFEDEAGEVRGPVVMKHWRQDWTYQDTDLHVFQGDGTWHRQRHSREEVAGTWTQAVYQVDDSPRYEVIGRWVHGQGFAAWHSRQSSRPLPRREHSVRDDYDILRGEHRITLTPTGWVHQQYNRKIALQQSAFKKGALEKGALEKTALRDGTETFLATEIGLNRYQRLRSPELAGAAGDYWARTGAYWRAVRRTWAQLLERRDRFRLRDEYQGRRLFQHHFDYVDTITSAAEYDAEVGTRHARDTIEAFVEAP